MNSYIFDIPSEYRLKISNYENIYKSKISKSNFSKTWRKTRKALNI